MGMLPELYDDATVFLQGCLDIYPDSEYAYYAHYLAARSCQMLSRLDAAAGHCRASLSLNPDFEAASRLLEELLNEGLE